MNGIAPVWATLEAARGLADGADVAGGSDIRRCQTALVDDYSASQCESAVGEPFGVWDVAGRGDHDIGAEHVISTIDTGDVGVAEQSNAIRGEDELHASFFGSCDDSSGEPVTEEPAQRRISVDDGDVETACCARGGYLHAEKPGADDEDGSGRCDAVCEVRRIGNGADDVLAPLGGCAKPTRTGPGGDDEPVVWHQLSIGKDDATFVDQQLRDRSVEPNRHVVAECGKCC